MTLLRFLRVHVLMAPNPYEEQARAVKAFKLARAARRLMRETDLPIEAFTNADEEARKRFARFAGVQSKRAPSEATWQIMLALLRDIIERHGPE
jgi:hypothetical protein